MATCRTCGGTGKILCGNSMFTQDGYHRVRCGICAGSGVSSYNPDPEYRRWQAAARARVAEWKGLKPRVPKSAQLTAETSNAGA